MEVNSQTKELENIMTRKDYIAIADALRIGYVYWQGPSELVVKNIAERIADKMELDNPRFDRNHFLAVVTGKKDLNSRPARTNHVRRVMAESENE
jgi:hypothetical protein